MEPPPAARPKTPTRSARDTNSARVWTCIFSITLWRWALIGTFGTAQRAGDLLVGVAANDKFEDLPLTRRQRRDTGANHVQPALHANVTS